MITDELYQNVVITFGQIVQEGLPEDLVKQIMDRLEIEASIEDVKEALKSTAEDITALAL